MELGAAAGDNLALEQLEYIEKLNIVNQQPEHVVIWLHGLGADYNDFLPIVPEIKLNSCVKFIFPNAPLMPVTINNGYVMRAWYDIRDTISLNSTIDKQGIQTSVKQIGQLIDSLIDSGWRSDRIILAGFSQGAVIAYLTGIQSKHRLCGIMALSGYLPELGDWIKVNDINKKTPIFACHGKEDSVVPYAAGFAAYNSLRSSGFSVSWAHYPMDHGLCNEEIKDITLWLKNIFI